MNFYNDNDPRICAWLRELIRRKLIPNGVVDERSISEIKPRDLDGFSQCHFFAGIGGWAYALQLASWPEDREVWTGSCPCQPFSQAGKGKVDSDERHVWPAFRTLIAERKPSTVFGEQVASADGRIWLAGVRADVEKMGYVLGAADLCAAGISAPMVSQRLHWVATANGQRREEQRSAKPIQKEQRGAERVGGEVKRVGATDTDRRETRSQTAPSDRHGNSAQPASRHNSDGLGETEDADWRAKLESEATSGGRTGFTRAMPWDDFLLVEGPESLRRVKPGLSLLAHGVPGRVAQLRGFGNALVPQLAAEFIRAYLDLEQMNTNQELKGGQ